jgi:hypothetical protein
MQTIYVYEGYGHAEYFQRHYASARALPEWLTRVA